AAEAGRGGGPRGGGGPGDAELARRRLRRLDEGTFRRRRLLRFARVAGDDVQPERSVEHGAAETAVDREARPWFARRRERDAAAGGLEAEEAAGCGRDSDRAA